MKCGELRWSDREGGWEVLIPSVAFKNSGSSFFGQKPFRLILPDLLDLYKYLEAYIDRHRGVLLGSAKDPGTFFVKTVKTTSYDAAYDSTKFYKAWRTIIQCYGIYNPYRSRRHQRLAAAWTSQHSGHPRNPRLEAHRILRASKLCDPGYPGCRAGPLRPVPVARQGGACGADPESGLGSRLTSKCRRRSGNPYRHRVRYAGFQLLQLRAMRTILASRRLRYG
jgi:hypothetical protein